MPCQVTSVRLELHDIHNCLALHPGDPVLRDSKKAALAKLVSLSKAEEALLLQKSRVHWLAEGDKNTRFFHNSIKNRLNRNKLVPLTLDDGNRIFDVPSIKREVVNHFSALLGYETLPYPSKATLAPFVTKRLEDRHQAALDMEVSHEEVKSALFSIHSNKSPGPDDFNAFFSKRVWHIIGEE